MTRTLIVFGSRRGSTRSCAELIQRTIGGSAELADVARGIPDLRGCDRIFIGANAFSSKLNKRVIRFVRDRLSQLLDKEVHLFMCSGSRNEAEERALFESSYPGELLMRARTMRNLGGRLETGRESALIRLVLRRMGKEDYDTIRPEEIASWAGGLPGAGNAPACPIMRCSVTGAYARQGH